MTTLSLTNSSFIHSHCTSLSKPTKLLPFIFRSSFNSIHLFPRRPPRGVRMDSSSSPSTSASAPPAHQIHSHHHHHHHHRRKDKVVVIMGATGCGKTKVSIDLATRFFSPSEIINSDKMQVYRGLDVTTNKIPLHDRLGVPHHFLGELDPLHGEFSPAEFRLTAGLAIADIVSRHKLPVVVGGSCSVIHALLVDWFNPELDVFNGSNPVSTQLRYNCCFLWIDVSLPVLCDYLCWRVDEMLDLGMFEELTEFFNSVDPASQPGLSKAIGVPEFERYFKGREEWDDEVRARVYSEAVREIKENTCELAKRQIGKIMRLKGAGWDLQRVDATEAFKEVMRGRKSTPSDCSNEKMKRRKMEVWEREVVEPSVKIVKRFLEE